MQYVYSVAFISVLYYMYWEGSSDKESFIMLQGTM